MLRPVERQCGNWHLLHMRDEIVTTAWRDDLGASYTALRGELLGYLRSRLADAWVAEDLLQTAFLRALASPGGVSREKIAPWLHAIVRNALIDHYRTRRAMDQLPADLAEEPVDHVQASVRALATCLEPLVDRLPAIYRDVLRGTEFEGKSLRTVADELQVSLSAVKSRASRGRRMLRSEVLACCHVEQAPSGAIVDHHRRAACGCGDSDDAGNGAAGSLPAEPGEGCR